MTLDEVLEAVRGVTGDTVGDLPGYADEIARIFTTQDSAMAEVNQALAQKDAEIEKLQAANYRLMVAASEPADPDPAPDPSEDGDPEDSGDFDITDYIKEDD